MAYLFITMPRPNFAVVRSKNICCSNRYQITPNHPLTYLRLPEKFVRIGLHKCVYIQIHI